MKCYECNSEMVLRTQKSTGELFWGCSTYPRCKATARFSDLDAVIPKHLFDATPMQQDIFDHITDRKGNLIVQAVAGSGKTTTILQALQLLPKGKRAIFLAFNKAIADTLSVRAPASVEVRTLHSLGFKCIRRVLPKATLDADKDSKIAEEITRNKGIKTYAWATALFGFIRNNLSTITQDSLEEVIDYYGLDIPEHTDIYAVMKEMWHVNEIQFRAGVVSFDDLIYWPAMDPVICDRYDYIFVDECQDLNKAQIRFILNCVGPETIVVGVGDRYQSIYGFRGADVGALDYLKSELHAAELPLSVSFRCPISHVAMAKKIAPAIEARENAEMGDVFYINREQFKSKVTKEDLVMCRVNAPLLPLAFELIKEGKPASIKGRDIASSLITMLQTVKDKGTDEAAFDILAKANTKASKLAKQNKLGQASYVLDLADCCMYILTQVDSVSSAITTVSKLFQDNPDGIVLSSIHKAKGLEAGTVFIVNYHLQPLRVKIEWEQQQELNLMYVALTRAKHTIYFTKI